ncbi:response regulator [Sphingomonas endophytica]|uniref:DNA-binding response OmpR family regulator n=1 Tax=Sphingomonas endophytica TaxID=869719 RepID=A0ABR6N7D4_9SPHN|nr:response regulator [Sphingomonas endophytica]MBB5726710.1 DNA-binding response OmpR family regulator [Sphingomonas endophytica]
MNNSVLVLLVEDQALILDILEEALKDAKFDVLTADSGAAALAILDRQHSDLAVLVSDIRLGGGPNGWEVARRARELRPSLPVIYMTGDSASDWAAQGVPKSVLLQKPFAPVQVVTAVAMLLNEASLRTD